MMGAIGRALKAAWQELKKPVSYVRGDEFERYIRINLFPTANYALLHKNHDYFTSQDFSIESAKEPDFRFESIKTEFEFYIEAKYRSRFYSGKLEWCKTYQLRRYQVINKSVPLFIVLGVGGEPMSPAHVYLIPIKHIKYTVFFHSYLRKYEVSACCCITEDDLRSAIDERKTILL